MFSWDPYLFPIRLVLQDFSNPPLLCGCTAVLPFFIHPVLSPLSLIVKHLRPGPRFGSRPPNVPNPVCALLMTLVTHFAKFPPFGFSPPPLQGVLMSLFSFFFYSALVFGSPAIPPFFHLSLFSLAKETAWFSGSCLWFLVLWIPLSGREKGAIPLND